MHKKFVQILHVLVNNIYTKSQMSDIIPISQVE